MTFPFALHADLKQAKLAWLKHAHAAKDGDQLVAVALACPSGRASTLLASEASERFAVTSYYRPSGAGDHCPLSVGLGVATQLRATTSAPFSEVQQYLEKQKVICESGLRPYLRYFGGGAFDPRRPHEESCWRDFGAASLILPRVTLVETEGAAALIVVASRETVETVFDELRFVLALLGRADFGSEDEPPPASLQAIQLRDSADQSAWTAMLTDAQEQMKAGTLEKVVAARRMTVRLSHRPRFSAVIQRLVEQAPGCSVFALRIGYRIFVGATPETLIEKEGLRLRTEALAGTVARGTGTPDDEAQAALLASEKDLHEHRFVAQMLSDLLSPIAEVRAAKQPQIRSLKRMYHLWTPIVAQLKTPAHVLQLVASLHPTPAVGGLPRAEAVDFILQQEQVERGWYAAPFGWCNQEGDGHFLVALRSALIAEDKVHVYAGAGIVAESDAGREYQETELKMGSILGALGLAS